MATKKKTKAKLPPPRNPKMAVVTSHSRMRHIGTTTKNPRPLCGTEGHYYHGWTASTAKKKHELPICKGCIKVVKSLTEMLEKDWMYVDRDELFERSRAEFEQLLEELDD